MCENAIYIYFSDQPLQMGKDRQENLNQTTLWMEPYDFSGTTNN